MKGDWKGIALSVIVGALLALLTAWTYVALVVNTR